MAHAQQAAWCQRVKARYPEHFHAKRVLDVGSLDINGSNRYLFTDCTYIGIDVVPGRNVDIVDPQGMAHYFADFTPKLFFDTIISSECLEHDAHWMETLPTMAAILKPGGLMLFTAATTGRPEHGTSKSSPADAPGLPWPDYYQNVTEDMVRSVLDMDLFSEYEFAIGVETRDIYFCAIRRQAGIVRGLVCG